MYLFHLFDSFLKFWKIFCHSGSCNPVIYMRSLLQLVKCVNYSNLIKKCLSFNCWQVLKVSGGNTEISSTIILKNVTGAGDFQWCDKHQHADPYTLAIGYNSVKKYNEFCSHSGWSFISNVSQTNSLKKREDLEESTH